MEGSFNSWLLSLALQPKCELKTGRQLLVFLEFQLPVLEPNKNLLGYPESLVFLRQGDLEQR